MPKLFGVSLLLGSGKPETPWSRMQAAYLSNIAIVPEPPVVLGLLEDPQAAITIAQIAALSAMPRKRRRPWFGACQPVGRLGR